MVDIAESDDKVTDRFLLEYYSYYCQLTCEGAARDRLDPLEDRLEPKSANSVLGVLRDELRDG